MRLTGLVAFLLLSAGAFAGNPPPCPGSGNTSYSLGNGWSCIYGGYNTGGSSGSLQVAFGAAINTHDLLVGYCDNGLAPSNSNSAMGMSDATNGTWTPWPLGRIAWANPDAQGGGNNNGASAELFYVLNATAVSSGLTVTCTTSDTVSFQDMAIALFRQTSGLASQGIDAKNSVANGNTTSSAPYTMDSISITTSYNGELLILSANGSGCTQAISGWIGADGATTGDSCEGLIQVRSQASAGTISASPIESDPDTGSTSQTVEMMLSFQSSTSGADPTTMFSGGILIGGTLR